VSEGSLGARWVAGGTQLAFTRTIMVPVDAGDGGDAGLAQSYNVAVAAPSGGALRDLVVSDFSTETLVMSPGNGGCSMTAGGGTGMAAAFGVAFAGVVALVRRRRRPDA